MRVLVGDIGGTKTVLGVVEINGDDLSLAEPRRYASTDHPSLEEVVRRYLEETRLTCRFGAFAIAGPIQGRRSSPTNLPWEVDADAIEDALGLAGVALLNDLEAVAWGVPALESDDLAELYPGDGKGIGNACVVAAGTGLGEAGLYWDGVRHHPFATEGGHADFAPADDLEFALLMHLQGRFGRVSWERVVSGPGIANLYDFMLHHRATEPPDWLRDEIAASDTAQAVAEAAEFGRCAVCAETMALFFRLYGREVGNMALKQMALGGVFLGGGIAPKNLDALRKSQFLQSFFNKGRMTPLMRQMPVWVILQPHTPLLGAARFLAAQ